MSIKIQLNLRPYRGVLTIHPRSSLIFLSTYYNYLIMTCLGEVSWWSLVLVLTAGWRPHYWRDPSHRNLWSSPGPGPGCPLRPHATGHHLPRWQESGCSTLHSHCCMIRLNLVKNINFGLEHKFFLLTYWKIVFWVTEHFCIKWTFWKNAFFCPKNASLCSATVLSTLHQYVPSQSSHRRFWW